jgi:hypothetical protein
MENKKVNLSEFAPVGKKQCESKCDRQVVMTEKGPVVACLACKRIVIDRR